MNDNDRPTYDIRKDDQGWTVFVTATGEPARVNGVPQTGLDIQDADELAEALGILDEQNARATKN